MMHIFHNGSHLFLYLVRPALTHFALLSKHKRAQKLNYYYINFICSSLMLFMIFCVNMNVYFSTTKTSNNPKNKECSRFFFNAAEKKGSFVLLFNIQWCDFGQILIDSFLVSRHLVRSTLNNYSCRWRLICLYTF